jgi:sporulation protein YlmC with PRC-barrel domain
MPRHEWYDEDTMSRDRSERRNRDFDERSSGTFFGREERRPSGRGLMRDESSGGRFERSRERGYGPDDFTNDIPTDETERLIASNKVEGTPVYDRNGDRLGSIYNFMVDKFRGKVTYAVLRHSKGFLGLDERYYPIDWDQLTYDTRLGGYHVNLTEYDLERSGRWDARGRWEDRQREFGRNRGRFERSRERDYRPDFERGSLNEPW